MKVKLNKEIELTKTQTKIKLEIKTSGCQTKPSGISFTNKLKDMKQRPSGLEGKIEEMDR